MYPLQAVREALPGGAIRYKAHVFDVRTKLFKLSWFSIARTSSEQKQSSEEQEAKLARLLWPTDRQGRFFRADVAELKKVDHEWAWGTLLRARRREVERFRAVPQKHPRSL